jgi:hypothetical protein
MLIISTSAEIEFLNEMRTQEYKTTIQWLKENSQNHNVVWLECVSNNISYVQDSFPVYYSNCHNPNYTNKGANLGQSLKKFFDICEVKDDLCLQMTGRYNFLSRKFLDTIENNPDYDFYGLEQSEYQQYYTGCFAIKTNHLKEFASQTDRDKINYYMINFEKVLWDYVNNNQLNSLNFDEIDIRTNIFGNGECELVYR